MAANKPPAPISQSVVEDDFVLVGPETTSVTASTSDSISAISPAVTASIQSATETRQVATYIPRSSLLGVSSGRFEWQHEMLATAVGVTDETDHGLMTLYTWYPPQVSERDEVMLSPAQLPYLGGFASLGTFFLPIEMDISKALSDLLATRQAALHERPTAQLLEDLFSSLPVPEADKGQSVSFYSFPVISNKSDELVLSHDDRVPLWRWMKPKSEYRKAGPWEASLHKALEHGEWNGGKNLFLLVQDVTERQAQPERVSQWNNMRVLQ